MATTERQNEFLGVAVALIEDDDTLGDSTHVGGCFSSERATSGGSITANLAAGTS